MSNAGLPRRSFPTSMIALPAGLSALSQGASLGHTVIKVGAESGRLNEVIKLPGGYFLSRRRKLKCCSGVHRPLRRRFNTLAWVSARSLQFRPHQALPLSGEFAF